MLKYELNLRDYIRIIRKRKVVIFAALAMGILMSLHQESKRKLVFEASTTVQVQQRKSVAGMLTEVMVFSPGDIMETQARIIVGFPVLIQSAVKMGYIDESASKEEKYKAAQGLQGRIRTERVGRTNIIRIYARASDPYEAKQLADIVAKAFVHESLRVKNLESSKAKEFIEDQLGTVKQRLENSEDKLRLMSDEVDNITVSEDVYKKLLELEFELANLLQKYTEKHPKVRMIREEINEREKQIKGFSGKQLEYSRLKREVDVAKNIFSMLSQKLEEVKIVEAGKVSGAEVVDPAVLPGRAINSRGNANLVLGSILGLLIGFVISFIVETLDTSMGTIEDVENVVKLSVLGVVPSVGPEDGEYETALDKLKRKIIPGYKKKRRRAYVSMVVHRNPTAPTAEAFRNLKTNLRIGPDRKVFLLTSAGPQEGKTTSLINLAIACAQDGMKVLLISSDLRRPTVAESFGMKKRPGISDILMGTVSLDEGMRGMADMMLGKLGVDFILANPGLDRLWILPAGSLPLNPAEVLDSQELDKMISWMRDEFDVVFFDSPPVLPVADASILAPKMDATVLCYEIGRTSRHALIRAKAQLEAVNANISGVILNHIQPETEAVEVYPYYYRYRYYSQDKDDSLLKRNDISD